MSGQGAKMSAICYKDTRVSLQNEFLDMKFQRKRNVKFVGFVITFEVTFPQTYMYFVH